MRTPRIGLYYPYSHFRDPNWLKLAALYWPRMSRIAPDPFGGIELASSRELIAETDLIVDVDPGGSTEEVALTIATVVNEHRSDLFQRYGIPRRHVSSISASSGTGEEIVKYEFSNIGTALLIGGINERWPEPVHNVRDDGPIRLIGLTQAKMAQHLSLLLEDSGLAAVDENRRFVALHPNLAWAYMCMLADHIASTNSLTAVSDDPAAFSASNDWTAERLAAVLLDRQAPQATSGQGIESAIGMLALQAVVPVNIAAVPVSTIASIRERRMDELLNFRQLVDDTASDLSLQLSEIADPAVLEAYLALEVKRRFEQPLKDLQLALRSHGVETALSTTAVRFEVPAAAAFAAGWATGQPVIAAAGAAFGFASWRHAAVKTRRETLRSSPVSYLWRVRRDLDGRGLVRRLLDGIKRKR